MHTAAAAPRKPGFPFRRLLADARYALLLNVLCALFVTFVLSGGQSFWLNLLASMCIGGIALPVRCSLGSGGGEFSRSIADSARGIAPMALAELRRSGIVVELPAPDAAAKGVGRPATVLALNPEAGTCVGIHLALADVRILVADVNAMWDKANRLQLRIGTVIDDRPYGLRDFVIVDPAGFGLRFAQILSP